MMARLIKPVMKDMTRCVMKLMDQDHAMMLRSNEMRLNEVVVNMFCNHLK